MKVFSPLFADAAALEDGTHEILIDHADLTETANATAQTVQIATITGLRQLVEVVRMELIAPFQDTADAANNSTLLEVGDDGDTDRFLTSTQLNVNGTEVYMKAGTGTRHVYSSDDTLDLLFTPPSGKNLAALNRGEVRIIVKLHDSRQGR
jgi:hypothetical protein